MKFWGSVLLFVAACGSGTSGTEVHVKGAAQKGPFITGSSLQLYPLDASLQQVGKVFTAFVSDDLGSFDTTVATDETAIEVSVTGFFADELTGEVSTSQLTLRAVAANEAAASLHINVLTTLAERRVKFLAGHGTAIADAETRAKNDVATAFGLDGSMLDPLASIDMTSGSPSAGAAIAVSAILLERASERASKPEDRISALTLEMSELAADLESDGVISAEHTKNLAKAAHFVDVDKARANLIATYSRLGMTIEVPDLLPFVQPLANLYPWARRGAAPMFADATAACAVGTKVYFAGGCNTMMCDSVSNKLWEYDPTTGALAEKMAMPKARAFASCGVVGGKLYVIGGLTVADDPATALTDVDAYDPAANSWTAKTGTTTASFARPAAVVGTKIYLVGSSGDLTVPTGGEVDAYDTVGDSWAPATSMMPARAYAAVCAIGSKIYVAGGFQKTATALTALNSIAVYNTTMNAWTLSTMPLPSARGAAGCAVIGGKPYIFGGADATGATLLADTLELDPTTFKLTAKTPMDAPATVPGAASVGETAVVFDVTATGPRIDRYTPTKE